MGQMENRGFDLERWPFVGSHIVLMDNMELPRFVQGSTEILGNYPLDLCERSRANVEM